MEIRPNLSVFEGLSKQSVTRLCPYNAKSREAASWLAIRGWDGYLFKQPINVSSVLFSMENFEQLIANCRLWIPFLTDLLCRNGATLFVTCFDFVSFIN
jgi:hypothetical protein